MNLSPRETRLALLTGIILLAGLTHVVFNNRLARLREIRAQTTAAQLELYRNQRELMRRPELLQTLETVRAQLPSHPEGRDVRSDILRQIQGMARQAGLTPTGLTPEQEEILPDIGVNQLSIRCTWNASPESLVNFLLRMQMLGAVMDVRELRFRASPRAPDQLTGSFIVDSAFTRVPATESADTSPIAPAAPAVSDAPVSESPVPSP